jgi:hypothetical protein
MNGVLLLGKTKIPCRPMSRFQSRPAGGVGVIEHNSLLSEKLCTPSISRQDARVKQLLDKFTEEPTPDNYVALRRYAPNVDIEIAKAGEIDPLRVTGDALKSAGIDLMLVRGALGGDDRDIDHLCLGLIESLIERRKLEADGGTHLRSRASAISDAIISHLIVALVEVLQHQGLSPPSSLVVLLREHLAGSKTEIEKAHAKIEGRDRALVLALQIKRAGATPTIRKLARMMKVQPSTVSRWFPDGDFREQLEKFERSFVTFPSNPSTE